jgi:hypothetical protein
MSYHEITLLLLIIQTSLSIGLLCFVVRGLEQVSSVFFASTSKAKRLDVFWPDHDFAFIEIEPLALLTQTTEAQITFTLPRRESTSWMLSMIVSGLGYWLELHCS